jgi:hypothetical protein
MRDFFIIFFAVVAAQYVAGFLPHPSFGKS